MQWILKLILNMYFDKFQVQNQTKLTFLIDKNKKTQL
jgi:hypothetical protein